jgi:hypothetical protein
MAKNTCVRFGFDLLSKQSLIKNEHYGLKY